MPIDTTGSRSGPPPDAAVAQPGSPSAKSEFLDELERARQLASQVSSWGGGMLSLARLELQLAAQCLPRMLALAMALLPLAGLAWISLSLLLAWLAYVVTGIVAVGLTVVFLLQLLMIALCLHKLKKLRAKSAFPETRAQWHQFFEDFNDKQDAPSGHPAENRA